MASAFTVMVSSSASAKMTNGSASRKAAAVREFAVTAVFSPARNGASMAGVLADRALLREAKLHLPVSITPIPTTAVAAP